MLTQHQSEVLEQSLGILRSSDRLVVQGSAGVGKTYMVDQLIKRLESSRFKKIYCSAPTNKAVSVLKDKVSSTNNLEFITTHSALKLKRQITRTGEVIFKPWFNEKYPPLKNVSYFIIDEASMISTELLGYIEEYSTMHRTKVIFIGDEKQLNPVGEYNSPVFHQNYPNVTLTEIIRQGEGNPIIDLSRNIDWIGKKPESLVEKENGNNGFLYSDNLDQIVERLSEVNGTDDLKYLAWTNKEVDRVNSMVRSKIYINPGKIEIGETLVFDAPYGDSHFANEEIKVEGLVIEDKKFYASWDKSVGEMRPVELSVYRINPVIMDDEKYSGGVVAIHEDSEEKLKKFSKELKERAVLRLIDWPDYFNFVEKFASLKYNHAITVHKSQGSTYRRTILNVKNIRFNKNQIEKERMLYTGITRASELLILYNI